MILDLLGPIALAQIALLAKGLKVVVDGQTPLANRDNVVNMQRDARKNV